MSIRKYLVRLSYGANSYFDLGCFFFFLWLVVNIIFRAIEQLIFGEAFVHFGDVILGFVTGYLFSYCCYLKAEVKIQRDIERSPN